MEELRSEKMGNTNGVCSQARPTEGSPGSKLGLYPSPDAHFLELEGARCFVLQGKIFQQLFVTMDKVM